MGHRITHTYVRSVPNVVDGVDKMSRSRTHGIKRHVRGIVLTARPGDHLTVNTIFEKFPKTLLGSSRSAVTGNLSELVKEGMLERLGRGVYVVHRTNGTAEPTPVLLDDEVIVIDQLLSAMAAAEPVLKKYKPVITALRNIK